MLAEEPRELPARRPRTCQVGGESVGGESVLYVSLGVERWRELSSPVLTCQREMWHRGSLAWRQILSRQEELEEATRKLAAASKASIRMHDGVSTLGRSPRTLLVVAHNNTNQALIATALGLPCSYFR